MDRPSSARPTRHVSDHGRVQPSIRLGGAARRPQVLMIRSFVPYHVCGLASDGSSGLDGAR